MNVADNHQDTKTPRHQEGIPWRLGWLVVKIDVMDFLQLLNEPLPRDERKIEQICRSFDMDCVDLNHEACWRGDPGIMPCCGLEVEFEKEHGICPFLWLKEE